MKRHRQFTADTYDLDKPTQGEVDRFLEPALVKLRETFEMYARFPEIDAGALAALRFTQTFPPHTTGDQIQDALKRRDARVQSPAERMVS